MFFIANFNFFLKNHLNIVNSDFIPYPCVTKKTFATLYPLFCCKKAVFRNNQKFVFILPDPLSPVLLL